MNRLESLDWLRGLLALSIMVYHLTCWNFREPDASEVVGRLGIYGVSMFFTLSGLSMAVVYHAYIQDLRTSQLFFVRRIFRIWPLLWAAVAVVTLGNVVLKKEFVDLGLVFLNITTLFGFVNPGAYINTGAWSIGNEMVYYALTPLFLAAYNRNCWLGNFVTIITAAIALYFGFAVLDRTQTLASQWQAYIHPLNNLIFYCGGIALFYNARQVSLSLPAALSLISASILAFVTWPVDGDLITTVTGLDRIAFFVITTALVFGFYKLTGHPHRLIARPLATFGVATYGIYLLHPIIHSVVKLLASQVTLDVSPWITSAATVAMTIVAAIVSYERLESPAISLGKRLTSLPVKAGKGVQ